MSASTRLAVGPFVLAWLAALAAMLVLDGIWLGLVARGLYQREMGTLMADPVRIVPIVAFYLLFPIGLVYLTLLEAPSGWGDAVVRGAVFGLAAYGAYDLTNLAVVRDWPVRLSMIDWAWGAVICAASAAAGYAVTWARRG
jgi:uncharacterized membrane protein